MKPYEHTEEIRRRLDEMSGGEIVPYKRPEINVPNHKVREETAGLALDLRFDSKRFYKRVSDGMKFEVCFGSGKKFNFGKIDGPKSLDVLEGSSDSFEETYFQIKEESDIPELSRFKLMKYSCYEGNLVVRAIDNINETPLLHDGIGMHVEEAMKLVLDTLAGKVTVS